MEQASASPTEKSWSQVEVYEYPRDLNAPDEPDWSGYQEQSVSSHTPKPLHEHVTRESRERDQLTHQADLERKLTEERQLSFEEGRQRGILEGRQAERSAQTEAHADSEQEQRRQYAQLVESFTMERDRFLHAVEQEVVRLALAIAARILRREAQMDPLLLTGAVRVALGQLAGSAEVRLKVPAGEVELWRDVVAHLPNLALKPAVEVGVGMRLGECGIESRMGTVDLGIRAQLAEIERGFFDRPGGDRAEMPARLADLSQSGPRVAVLDGAEGNG